MAIYRNIQISFWTDTKIVDDFTPEDRYFYLYLFTNPHTNMCGCYELSLKQAAIETGYDAGKVEALLDRFQTVHKVIAYSHGTKELLLVNWYKYNWTSSPKFLAALYKEIMQVKKPEFKDYLQRLSAGENTVSIPYQKKEDTVSIPYRPEAETATEEKAETGSGAQKPAYQAKADAGKADEIRLVAEHWNALQDAGIKPVSKLTPKTKRYDMIAARISQYGVDNVIKAIDGIRNSSFLTGKNQRGWQITFDWFALPNNFPKVLEGNYTDKKPVTAPEADDSNPYAEWR